MSIYIYGYIYVSTHLRKWYGAHLHAQTSNDSKLRTNATLYCVKERGPETIRDNLKINTWSSKLEDVFDSKAKVWFAWSTYARAHTPGHTHTHTRAHTHTHAHTHTFFHTITNTQTIFHTFTRTHIHTHTNTNTQTHTHTCTQTFTLSDALSHSFFCSLALSPSLCLFPSNMFVYVNVHE